jgi:hypothetical protein
VIPRLPPAARPALEVGALVAACVAFVGPGRLRPDAPAVGWPTRDLFDHVALLDRWSVRADDWALPDGGALVPPDLGSMLLAAPALAAELGRGTAHNLAMLGSLVAACLAGWALGRRVGNGLVGGVAFGLSPYLLGQALSGEAETLSAWPLALMAVLLEVGGPRAWVGAGLAAGAAAVGSWYHGAFAGAVMLTWVLLSGRLWGPGQDLRVLLAPGAFFGAVIGPALAYADVLRAPDQLFRGPDMATYLAEHPRALAGMVGDPGAWLGVGAGGANHVDGLGLLTVVLAAVGLVGFAREDRRAALRWGGVLLLGLVLSLGPSLHIGGADTGVPLPGRLLAELPLLGLMRLPHRWLLVATLALAVLAARGARRLPAWAGLFLAVEALWFLVPARPAVDLTPPAVHAQVTGPVLDLPPRTLGELDLRGRYLVWQRDHGQAIPYALLMQPLGPSAQAEPLLVAVAALDTRDPMPDRLAEAAQFRSGDFARAVRRTRARGVTEDATEGAADRLRALGLSQVVLHRSVLDEDDDRAIVALLSAALGEPAAEVTDEGEEALLWQL